MALYGKVIRIFDETTLLVNIGSKDGMKRGDGVFIVETGEEITDPDTGESLGALETVKAELTAVDVQERITVLKTIGSEAHDANLPLSARMVRDSVRSGGDREKMTVVHGEMAGLPSPAPVRVGDTVRRVE
jgi:hypothetical protein